MTIYKTIINKRMSFSSGCLAVLRRQESIAAKLSWIPACAGMTSSNGQFGLLVFCVLFFFMVFTGCVSQNKNILSVNIDANELSGHVHFLAQPALKGRKPLSSGSKTARKYIAKQFKSFGLVPWGDAKSYMQSFVVGTNVIGVLEGSDPNLKDEYVIVCAHYDHVGKTKDKGVCLGACDNASGVAAMLEIAETLSLSEVKPKRSICFAAFDCEEIGLLGAFAFSSRTDFDESKIAGVVNIDALGRYGYEVLDEHLFICGVDECVPLFNEMKQSDSEIQLLPVSKEIVGMRGDHFPFELLDCPVLFFCNGMFEDYHKSTDTADKLDYNKMLESTDIICYTINVIANKTKRFERQYSPEGQEQVFASLQICLEHIIEGYTKLGWTERELDSMKVLSKKLEQLREESQINTEACRIFLLTQYENLRPLIFWPEHLDANDTLNNSSLGQYKLWGQTIIASDFYPEIIGIGRDFIEHLETNSSSLISGMPEFEHREYVFPDNYISIANIDKDTYCLIYAIATIGLKVELPGLVELLNNQEPTIQQLFSLNSYIIKGTKQELVDNCLLRWKRSELNKLQYPSNKKGIEDGHWPKVLSKITQIKNLETYQQWSQYRLAQGRWENEEQWLVNCIESTNPDVAKEAIALINKILPEQAEEILVNLISNETLDSEIRESAIRSLNYISSSTLLFLVDMLDNETDCSSSKNEMCAENLLSKIIEFNQFVFLSSLINETKRTSQIPKEGTYFSAYLKVTVTFDSKGKPIIEETEGPPEVGNVVPPFFRPATLGDCAWLRLAQLTKQNFEKNKEKWINWIQTHKGQTFPDPNKPKEPVEVIHIGF